METRKCQLKIEKIKIKNMNIPNCELHWKYDKESKTLYFRARKNDALTSGERETKINTALRDYGDWY